MRRRAMSRSLANRTGWYPTGVRLHNHKPDFIWFADVKRASGFFCLYGENRVLIEVQYEYE